MHCILYKSPIGHIEIVTSNDAVLACHFADSKVRNSPILQESKGQTMAVRKENFTKIQAVEAPGSRGKNTVLELALLWLNSYFSGHSKVVLPPLHLSLPEKTKRFLWTIKTLDFGSTYTYTEVANMCKTHPISLGQACAKNPIALFIPCHRVISKNPKHTYAYAGGSERKKWLLEFEAKR